MAKVELLPNQSFHYCELCQNTLTTFDVFVDDEHMGTVDLTEGLSDEVESLIAHILDSVSEKKE